MKNTFNAKINKVQSIWIFKHVEYCLFLLQLKAVFPICGSLHLEQSFQVNRLLIKFSKV